MNTKLTLTIDQSVIEKAKKYAKEKERSLSDLIENYLKLIFFPFSSTYVKTKVYCKIRIRNIFSG